MVWLCCGGHIRESWGTDAPDKRSKTYKKLVQVEFAQKLARLTCFLAQVLCTCIESIERSFTPSKFAQELAWTWIRIDARNLSKFLVPTTLLYKFFSACANPQVYSFKLTYGHSNVLSCVRNVLYFWNVAYMYVILAYVSYVKCTLPFFVVILLLLYSLYYFITALWDCEQLAQVLTMLYCIQFMHYFTVYTYSIS